MSHKDSKEQSLLFWLNNLLAEKVNIFMLAAGGSGEPNLSPAEYQMLNQLLRTKISNYYTKWGQEPSQERYIHYLHDTEI